MKKRLINSFLLLTFIAAGARGGGKRPLDVLGLRLGMTEEAAHERLRRVGRQQKEEREAEGEGGEQEVWILRNDSHWDYLVTKFDHQHRLLFVTAVVRKNVHMVYGNVADPKDARYATDGNNHSYSWTIAASNKQPACLAVARGSDPKFLTSYSLYRLRQKAN